MKSKQKALRFAARRIILLYETNCFGHNCRLLRLIEPTQRTATLSLSKIGERIIQQRSG